MTEHPTHESGSEQVYILVLRYHRDGDQNTSGDVAFTRCGSWIANASPMTRDTAEGHGFTYCRKCFGQDGDRPE